MRAWKQGQRIHRQVAPWLAPGSRVFEVGAGVGCTVKVFEQHGHRAAGIEPNDGFQAYSRGRLQADVSKGYLLDVPPDGSQDLVLLIQVIEHLRSPRESLEHLHRVIRPGGLLYVEAPNLGAFATPHRLFHFAHIHNFTPATLVAMANRCGFEVVQSFGSPLSPDLQFLLRREKQPRWHIPADSHEQTLAMLARFNFWSYHLRWDYLSRRSLDLASRGWEWVAAPGYVRSLLKNCGRKAAAA
jgi:SAM-dependent methyltransferase